MIMVLYLGSLSENGQIESVCHGLIASVVRVNVIPGIEIAPYS